MPCQEQDGRMGAEAHATILSEELVLLWRDVFGHILVPVLVWPSAVW